MEQFALQGSLVERKFVDCVMLLSSDWVNGSYGEILTVNISSYELTVFVSTQRKQPRKHTNVVKMFHN